MDLSGPGGVSPNEKHLHSLKTINGERHKNIGLEEENAGKAASEVKLLAPAWTEGYQQACSIFLTLRTEILESILLLHDALKCKAQQTHQKSFFIDDATTTYSLFCASEELVSGGWSHSHENYVSKENIWVQ